MDANLENFIKNKARNTDLCKDYKEYSKEVQQCLKNVYTVCWRFDLKTNQIIEYYGAHDCPVYVEEDIYE